MVKSTLIEKKKIKTGAAAIWKLENPIKIAKIKKFFELLQANPIRKWKTIIFIKNVSIAEIELISAYLESINK